MIAILSQAMLLELTVRLFGKNYAGYIVGAMLAMSWNLFHKIMNFIIFYGFNIVEIYKELLRFAQKQLSIRFEIIWLPILILLVVYCLLGVISALIGIKVGKDLRDKPVSYTAQKVHDLKPLESKPGVFNYSVGWLIFNVAMMVTGFVLLNFKEIYYWVIFITLIAGVWALRYKRALRQLLKPRFWISFVVITMLTAYVFSALQSQDIVSGILAGIKMNFRAILVIMGFTVLGTELYNPVIRNFFMRTSMKQLPLALELSFESLPVMIAGIPPLKQVIRKPVSVLYNLISQIENRLNEIKSGDRARVVLISGKLGEGKTQAVEKLVALLKEAGINAAGIISPRVVENGVTTGYDILDLSSGNKAPFLRLKTEDSPDIIGRFSIDPHGLKTGLDILKSCLDNDVQVVFIDEVGRLELNGKGWAEAIPPLMDMAGKTVVLAVRDSFADEVIEKWQLKDYTVFTIGENEKNGPAISLILDKIIHNRPMHQSL